MDSFPIEIWSIIFQMLSNRDLVALATTCLRFCTLAQDNMFRNVCFYPPGGPGENLSRTLSLFQRSNVERPALAQLVRSLDIRTFRFPWELRTDISGTLAWMPSFSNIQTLKVSGITIGSELRACLNSLPCLSSLTFHVCMVDAPDVSVDPSDTLQRPTVDLSVHHPISDVGWCTIAPGRLKSLAISASNNIVSDFILHGRNETLTTLHLLDAIPSNIISLLLSSPHLLNISLDYAPDPSHPLYSLPVDAIPLLECFSGPPEISSETFIRGRPVQTVNFQLPYDSVSEDILIPLQSSSVPVKKLVLAGGTRSQDANYLMRAPTSLQNLQCHLPDDLQLFLSVVCRLTDLRVLQLRRIATVIPYLEQEYLVYIISDVCTSLCECRFEVEGGVRGRWRKSANGHWECYLVS